MLISFERLEEIRKESTEDILGVPVLNPLTYAKLIMEECQTILGK